MSKTARGRCTGARWLLFVLGLLPAAAAAQFNWTGAGGDALWTTSGNWAGGIVPPKANNTFVSFPLGGTLASTVDEAWTLNRLDIDLGVRTIGGMALTFDGASAMLNINGFGHTISNDLVLASTVTIANSDEITLPGGITGAGGLTAAGAARLTLGGPGFHNGTTTINAGATLAVTGTPTLITVVDNGALELGVPGGVGITDPVTGSGSVTVTNGLAFGTFTHAGTTTVMVGAQLDGSIDNNALLALDGVMNVAASTVGSLAGGGELNLNFAGGVFIVGGDNTDSTFLGNINNFGDVLKIGAGRLTLGGSLSNGSITINDGTLRLGVGGSEPASVFTLVNNTTLEFDVLGTAITGAVTGGGTVAVLGGLTSGTFLHLGTTSVSGGARLDGTVQNASRLTLDGELNCLDISVGSLVGAVSGSLNLNTPGDTSFVGADNTDSTYLGDVTGFGNLTKTGSGRLTLAGNQLTNGTLTIASGTLRLGDGANGPPSAITIVNNGALELQVPTGIGITDPVNGSGTVSALGGLAFGNFFHLGTTSVSPGAQLDGSITNGARLSLDGVMNTGGSTVGSLAGAASGVLNVNSGTFASGGDNSDSTFAGVLASAGNFDKVGTGRLTLSGASTHFGTVSVLDGTLAVTGSLMSFVNVNGPGATLLVTGSIFNPVTVAQGLLAGTGTITFPVTVAAAGTLAPGLSPGIINTGSLNLSGTLGAEILGPAVGTQYDQVNVIGTVTLNNPALALTGAYAAAAGDAFILIANDGVDPVSGTFAGLAEGATLVFNGVTLGISYVGGDGNDVVLSHVAYTVTPSAGPNGTIAPNTPQSVAHGATTTFTVTPATGYTAVVGGTCGGTLVGATYTTNAIVANCTVDATFTLNAYTVTPSAGANGTIAPSSPQTIGHGATTTFTVTPSTGYTASVGGTCGGSLVGTTYTTNAIVANCSVIASFAAATYQVVPTAGPNGTIAPNTPQTVAHGATTTFTVTPDAGYTASVGGTCGGTLVGNTYTTDPILATCSVIANFTAASVRTFTGPTATGSGTATASFTGGGATCSFGTAQFIPVTGHPDSPPAGTAPAVDFPHGLFEFTLTNCIPLGPARGNTITMTITYPATLPPGTQYWKYGPTPGNATPHWYILPATITGNAAVFSITDGGLGDDDLTVNSAIVDQGGPGVPVVGAPVQTPTLSEWMLMVLASLMLGVGIVTKRRKLGPGPSPR